MMVERGYVRDGIYAYIYKIHMGEFIITTRGLKRIRPTLAVPL